MAWTPNQRVRLAIEKEKLEKYFLGGITWIDPTGETKVEVRLTSNSDTEYKLRIYLPPDYPNCCPKLVVVSPKQLLLNDGTPIPRLSGAFHTLERKDGFQSICHFYPPDWTADNTLYQVFMKGRLWIEAYEAHLDTGRNMDYYLGHQNFTPDPSNPWIGEDESDHSNSSDDNSDLFNSTDDDNDDVEPYWPNLSEPRIFGFEESVCVTRSNNFAARSAGDVNQHLAGSTSADELANSQPVVHNVSIPRQVSDVSVPFRNTPTSQRSVLPPPGREFFCTDQSPVSSSTSMDRSSSSSSINDTRNMSTSFRRSRHSSSELTSNVFHGLQSPPSCSDSSHNPTSPASPCSPISPSSPKDPNKTSSLPRINKPVGSVDVFAPLRRHCDDSTGRRRLPPPPVLPKPRRPRP